MRHKQILFLPVLHCVNSGCIHVLAHEHKLHRILYVNELNERVPKEKRRIRLKILLVLNINVNISAENNNNNNNNRERSCSRLKLLAT